MQIAVHVRWGGFRKNPGATMLIHRMKAISRSEACHRDQAALDLRITCHVEISRQSFTKRSKFHDAERDAWTGDLRDRVWALDKPKTSLVPRACIFEIVPNTISPCGGEIEIPLLPGALPHHSVLPKVIRFRVFVDIDCGWDRVGASSNLRFLVRGPGPIPPAVHCLLVIDRTVDVGCRRLSLNA